MSCSTKAAPGSCSRRSCLLLLVLLTGSALVVSNEADGSDVIISGQPFSGKAVHQLLQEQFAAMLADLSLLLALDEQQHPPLQQQTPTAAAPATSAAPTGHRLPPGVNAAHRLQPPSTKNAHLAAGLGQQLLMWLGQGHCWSCCQLVLQLLLQSGVQLQLKGNVVDNEALATPEAVREMLLLGTSPPFGHPQQQHVQQPALVPGMAAGTSASVPRSHHGSGHMITPGGQQHISKQQQQQQDEAGASSTLPATYAAAAMPISSPLSEGKAAGSGAPDPAASHGTAAGVPGGAASAAAIACQHETYVTPYHTPMTTPYHTPVLDPETPSHQQQHQSLRSLLAMGSSSASMGSSSSMATMLQARQFLTSSSTLVGSSSTATATSSTLQQQQQQRQQQHQMQGTPSSLSVASRSSRRSFKRRVTGVIDKLLKR
jgi:hypothetical protein